MQGLVQSGYRQLSKATGVPLVNVGKAWNDVTEAQPGFSLYQADGNHASVHGSYLTALVMFQNLSGLSPETTTWRPSGVDEQQAVYLRSIAAGGEKLRSRVS